MTTAQARPGAGAWRRRAGLIAALAVVAVSVAARKGDRMADDEPTAARGQWAVLATGDAVPAFGAPRGMASLPGGETLVVDRDRGTIWRLDADGTARGSWGARGVGPGTFDWPVAIAVMPAVAPADAEVIVADAGSGLLRRFSGRGVPVPSWQPPAPFDGPVAVAVEAAGTVLVAERTGNRVVRLGADGRTLAVWSGPRGDGTAFRAPSGVAAGPDGSLAVADSGNSRVVILDATGMLLEEIDRLGSDARLAEPTSIAFGRDGSLDIVDEGARVVWHRAPDGSAAVVDLGGDPGVRPFPVAVARDGRGRLLVADRATRQVRVVTAGGASAGAWGREGGAVGDLRAPIGLAVAGDGSIYVAEFGRHRVVRLGRGGELLGAFGGHGVGAAAVGGPGTIDGPGAFDGPYGVAVAPDGTVVVTDRDASRVLRFSADGRHLDGGSRTRRDGCPACGTGRRLVWPGRVARYRRRGRARGLAPRAGRVGDGCRSRG